MRVSEKQSYPYPVLSQSNDDYVSGKFELAIECQEDVVSGGLELFYQVSLVEPDITKMIADEKAKIGLFIKSSRTYKNEFRALNAGGGQISFQPGELLGKVELQGLVFASQSVPAFSADNLHPEFKDIVVDYGKGDLLAIAPRLKIEVGLAKLAPMESIFSFQQDNTKKNNQIEISVEQDKILILVNKETNSWIKNFREIQDGKRILLTSVYLPALMEVLSIVSVDSASLSNYRWYEIFTAKCRALNINLEKPEILRDAQILLQSPLVRLKQWMEDAQNV